MNELTREQILAMPAGRELDRLVMQHVTHYQPLTTAVCPDGTFDCLIPDYSTDIAAAWEVVEKMGSFTQLTCDRYHEKEIWLWHCSFSVVDSVEADTAPLAICRAALLAVTGL